VLGSEISLNEETVMRAERKELITLGDSNYLLIELPLFGIYPVHINWIEKLKSYGYKLIIAHVERYEYLTNNLSKLDDLLERGLLVQMNANYVIDKRTRKHAKRLLSKGYVQYVASDSHNIENRTPNLDEAYEIVSQIFDDNMSQLLMETNPIKAIENKSIERIHFKKEKVINQLFKRYLS